MDELTRLEINGRHPDGRGIGIRFVDLCAGIGGFRQAIEAAGGTCVFSSEINPTARLVYHANFGEYPSGDIKAIQAEDVPDHDVLCAGFPCQAFSIAGKGLGFGDIRGTIFFDLARIIESKRPVVVFLENVPNLVKHDGGRTFAVIRSTLEGLGYAFKHKVLNASLYGAPTTRKRVFIVAIRSDLHVASFSFPEPTREPVKLADVLLPDNETDVYVVRNHAFHRDLNAAVLSEESIALRPVCVGWVGERFPPQQGYRVYLPIGHAITFMARGGGVGAQTGLYWINERVRKLHPREMARVMGFPDSFVIPESLSYEQVRRVFGNSVVVTLVRKVFEAVAAALPEAALEAANLSSAVARPVSTKAEFDTVVSLFGNAVPVGVAHTVALSVRETKDEAGRQIDASQKFVMAKWGIPDLTEVAMAA